MPWQRCSHAPWIHAYPHSTADCANAACKASAPGRKCLQLLQIIFEAGFTAGTASQLLLQLRHLLPQSLHSCCVGFCSRFLNKLISSSQSASSSAALVRDGLPQACLPLVRGLGTWL